jgi:hypothetical protein
MRKIGRAGASLLHCVTNQRVADYSVVRRFEARTPKHFCPPVSKMCSGGNRVVNFHFLFRPCSVLSHLKTRLRLCRWARSWVRWRVSRNGKCSWGPCVCMKCIILLNYLLPYKARFLSLPQKVGG